MFLQLITVWIYCFPIYGIHRGLLILGAGYRYNHTVLSDLLLFQYYFFIILILIIEIETIEYFPQLSGEVTKM